MRISDWSSDVCSSDLFIGHELLAEGPMFVEERHADGRIGVQHLFRADDLYLVGIDVQLHFLERYRFDRVVDAVDEGKIPIAAREQRGGRSEENTSELHSLMRISSDDFCLKHTKKKIQQTDVTSC